MVALYILSITVLIASSYAALKTSQSDPGMQIRPGTPAYMMFSIFGGIGGSVAIIALLLAGFFVMSWWVPLIALVSGMFLSGIIYSVIRNGPLITFAGFPLGLVFGVISLIQYNPVIVIW